MKWLWISMLLVSGCALRTPPVVVVTPPGVPNVLVPTSAAAQKPMKVGYVPGVENFGFVTVDLWRGARPTREGFRTLGEMGVKTVVDLQELDEQALVPPGVKYVHLPTSEWWPDRVNTQAVLAAIDASPKPVFVHCHVGRDRTGLAVAAYRLNQGMKLGEVLTELHNFHVNPWVRGAIERRIQALAKQRDTPAAPALGG